MGILRINSFANGESAEVRNKLQDLLKQGAQKIVVDMRDTAGGSLSEAVAVAESLRQGRRHCSNYRP